MDERLAVLGLALLAALAWVTSPALRAARHALQGPGAVIYAVGDPERLFWSPQRLLREGEEGVDGMVLGADGTALEPVGGWRGLLLGNPLNLNRATQTDLEALPGIGPKTAAAILEARAARGGFRSPADLLAVAGVGPVTLERLRPMVCAELPGPGQSPIRPGDGPLE